MKDAPKTKSPQLDRLIAQSKQITADMLALRTEVSRKVFLRPYDSLYDHPATKRMDLLKQQLTSMRDEMYELWAQSAGLRDPIPEPKPFTRPAPRRIGQEKLFLTGGD